MTKNSDKILAFEYLVSRLIEWYRNSISSSAEVLPPHFSRLSILKLLFLTAAVKNDEIKGLKNQDLLGIFDKFCAMQYGPVEIDVYTAIVKGYTQIYKFDNNSIKIIRAIGDYFNGLDASLKESIDNSIALLISKNKNIVKYSATQLVNITHKWQSWQNAMWLANLSGTRQEAMTTESIRKDTPYYG